MIRTIAKHEFFYLFKTPLGWVLLAVVQAVFGGSYYLLLNNYLKKQQLLNVTEGVSYEVTGVLCAISLYLAILLVPVLTMRCMTSEVRNHSIALLFNAPVSNWSIVIGKYLGILCYLLLVLVLVAAMMFSTSLGSQLDIGIVLSALLSTFLLLCTYTAVSLWIASKTRQPALAILGSSCVLVVFLLLQMFANTRIEWLDQTFAALSLIEHYQPALKGLLRLEDIVFFAGLSSMFLALTTLRIRRMRAGVVAYD